MVRRVTYRDERSLSELLRVDIHGVKDVSLYVHARHEVGGQGKRGSRRIVSRVAKPNPSESVTGRSGLAEWC